MIPVQVRITKKLIDRIDELIRCGAYPNRSEVIRDAIRNHVISFNDDHFNNRREKQFVS
jgi:Arc/MetJ-type ribon-helix-helix transcriptional regulator